MQQKPKPSILRIIQSDMLALICVLIPIVVLGMYLAIMVFGSLPGTYGRAPLQRESSAPWFLTMGLASAAVGLPLAYWRIHAIQRRFEEGEEVTGRIIDVAFFRDRGKVTYSYVYQNQNYAGSNAIMKNGRTEQLYPGKEVVILVNPFNPKQALIRDLYT